MCWPAVYTQCLAPLHTTYSVFMSPMARVADTMDVLAAETGPTPLSSALLVFKNGGVLSFFIRIPSALLAGFMQILIHEGISKRISGWAIPHLRTDAYRKRKHRKKRSAVVPVEPLFVSMVRKSAELTLTTIFALPFENALRISALHAAKAALGQGYQSAGVVYGLWDLYRKYGIWDGFFMGAGLRVAYVNVQYFIGETLCLAFSGRLSGGTRTRVKFSRVAIECTSALVAALAAYPLLNATDRLRRNLVNDEERKHFTYTSSSHLIESVTRREGLGGFFTGIGWMLFERVALYATNTLIVNLTLGDT